MKLTLRKTAEIVIDTARERERIQKAFKDDKETQAKLNQLMDLIEAEEWEKAEKELDGKWWQGYDKKLECRRMEFIGMPIDHTNSSPFFDSWSSYADLVYKMVHYSNNYKIVSKSS